MSNNPTPPRIERPKKKYKGYISPIEFLRFVMENYTYCLVDKSWVEKSYRRLITEEQMLENFKKTL